jgi:hypothetical protein
MFCTLDDNAVIVTSKFDPDDLGNPAQLVKNNSKKAVKYKTFTIKNLLLFIKPLHNCALSHRPTDFINARIEHFLSPPTAV